MLCPGASDFIRCLVNVLVNGVARPFNNLRTAKGDYSYKQCFPSFMSLFEMGTSLKGKNLLPEGANSFL